MSRRLRLAALPMCLAALAALGGCELIGVAAPAPKQDARYVITTQPVVLLVESSPEAAGSPEQATMRNNLYDALVAEFREQSVSHRVVPEQEVRRVQRTSSGASQWTPDRLGRELDAEEVVHVIIEPYAASATSVAVDPTRQARLGAYVKVYDCTTGELKFPLEQRGELVEFELKTHRAYAEQADRQMQNQLAEGLADQITKLFYKHEMTTQESFGQRSGGADW